RPTERTHAARVERAEQEAVHGADDVSLLAPPQLPAHADGRPADGRADAAHAGAPSIRQCQRLAPAPITSACHRKYVRRSHNGLWRSVVKKDAAGCDAATVPVEPYAGCDWPGMCC